MNFLNLAFSIAFTFRFIIACTIGRVIFKMIKTIIRVSITGLPKIRPFTVWYTPLNVPSFQPTDYAGIDT